MAERGDLCDLRHGRVNDSIARKGYAGAGPAPFACWACVNSESLRAIDLAEIAVERA